MPSSIAPHAVSFLQSVDRALVHRHAVHEVFVTDLVEAGADVSLVGAQLPVSHAYFLDAADDDPAGYNALLLAECCRQACTIIAHTRYQVPADWVFLSAGTRLKLIPEFPERAGDRPGELVMTAHSDGEVRAGRLRTVHTTVEFAVEGLPVGSMTSDGRYLTADEYELLRASGRSGTAPLSTSLPVRPPGIPVPPELVGRTDRRNVLLADAHEVAGGVAAKLAVPGRHPTIFDHPLDHFPGMALLDAAGQLTRLALNLAGAAHRRMRTVGLDARFGRFAEIDAAVLLRATVDSADQVAVTFHQHDAEVAEVRVTMADFR